MGKPNIGSTINFTIGEDESAIIAKEQNFIYLSNNDWQRIWDRWDFKADPSLPSAECRRRIQDIVSIFLDEKYEVAAENLREAARRIRNITNA